MLLQETNTDSVNQGKTVFLSLDKYQNFFSDSVKSTTTHDSTDIVQTFLQESPTDFHIRNLQVNNTDSIIYILMVFTFFISLMWYYFPERILSLVNLSFKTRDYRSKENTGVETPGIIIQLFLILNYCITIAFFLFISTSNSNIGLNRLLDDKYFLFFLIASIGFYLYRFIMIFSTGFIFNTGDESAKQMRVYVNADNLSGILLIPVIFLMLFLKSDILIYSGFLILIFFQVFKWLQTIILGNTIRGFSILHLFMYLCTLEIVPLIVLIKLYIIMFD